MPPANSSMHAIRKTAARGILIHKDRTRGPPFHAVFHLRSVGIERAPRYVAEVRLSIMNWGERKGVVMLNPALSIPGSTVDSVRLDARSKQSPHLQERQIGFSQFGILQVYLNVVERGIRACGLLDLVPTIILLSPTILIS